MIITNYLDEKHVLLNREAESKDDVVRMIAKNAKESSNLTNISEDQIVEKLLKREQQSSTAFGNTIAIPHCGFENLNDFTVGLITLKDGVDFNSLDKKKTSLLFYIIGPASKRNEHIKILSSISRILKSKENVNKINDAVNFDEIKAIISEHSIKNEKDIHNESVIINVFIQKEKYFEDILEIFSESSDGNITIIETNNAMHYLNKMPVFSTFWTSDDSSYYNRIIIAVIEKRKSNDIIRKLNTLIDDIEKSPGILITANDLYYTNGSLDF